MIRADEALQSLREATRRFSRYARLAKETGLDAIELEDFAELNGDLPLESLHTLTARLLNGQFYYDPSTDQLLKMPPRRQVIGAMPETKAHNVATVLPKDAKSFPPPALQPETPEAIAYRRREFALKGNQNYHDPGTGDATGSFAY